MPIPSRTARRLTLAVLLTAVIPLVVAILIAHLGLARFSLVWRNPDVALQLERSLGVYQELARAIKDGMRSQADAIAARESLRAAANSQYQPGLQEELQAVFSQYPTLIELSVTNAGGKVLGHVDRGRPLDEPTELGFEVRRSLRAGSDEPVLVAKFATGRARFDELAHATDFSREYLQMDRSSWMVERSYLYPFAALLGLTMLGAATIGTLLARGVTQRIRALARATAAVGQGDLTVRVPEEGNDEITDLARAFNGMLKELELRRARIEFLQRMGTWQEMARRLAHEIKNPLTPIQLAVQQCHRKYSGSDSQYQNLLDTTVEVVEEEVATLRRLVSEFSSFARLPKAELAEADLGEFLRERQEHLVAFSDDDEMPRSQRGPVLADAVAVSLSVTTGPAPAFVDKQMLHRVLVNIVRNAAESVCESKGVANGVVNVSLSDAGPEWFVLCVDDNGSGVPENLRETIFDPYMTTKKDGTGLGLAIVKKVVMEHGGSVRATASPLGGARIEVMIPKANSPAAFAACENSDAKAGDERVSGY